MRAVSALAAVLLAGACTAPPPPPPFPTPAGTPWKPPTLVNQEVRWQGALHFVRDVLDGRTVELADGVRVRVAGLATPADCAAPGALSFARTTLLASAVRVTTSAPGEVDLTLEDGTDYALLAVRQGALRADGGPLAAAETEAAAADRGLWGPPCDGLDAAPTPVAPLPPPVTTGVPRPVPTTGVPVTTPPVTTRPAARTCAVSYRVTGEWPGGFQAEVVVRNTGSAPIDGWNVRWTFGGRQAVTEMWNATVRRSGPAVDAVNAGYNPRIPPGGSVQIGFNGSVRGGNPVPDAFAVNGKPCSAG
ncbi:cellulose binding domain-containing protein [Lentzea sp. NPDC060358]|uniref:cellulose binding domain-containing protein n=1 Tax=Lentzea sp. NPDC060358 TaxID=3347103 RepID=UPI00365C445A